VMAKETKAYIKSVASRASADDIKAAGDYVKGLVGNKQITWGQWCGAMEDNGIATYTAALDAKFRPPVEKELDSKFRPRVGKKRVYTQMAPELTNGAPLKMDPYRPTCISYLLGLVTACR
jgi:hypothetical protein